jgi:carbonic anhydrase
MEECERSILLNNNCLHQIRIQEGLEFGVKKKDHPNYSIIVLTCMDYNIDPSYTFNLHPNDIIVLRNAGNVITEDMVRSIISALKIHDIKEIIIMGHTYCQIRNLDPKNLIKTIPGNILRKIGARGVSVTQEIIKYFHIFVDELRNIRNQVRALKSADIIPESILIKGYIHDDESGWVFDIEDEPIKKLESIKEFQTALSELKYEKVVKMNEHIRKNRLKEKEDIAGAGSVTRPAERDGSLARLNAMHRVVGRHLRVGETPVAAKPARHRHV